MLPTFNPEHMYRIAQKMRDGSSESADFVTSLMEPILQLKRAQKARADALQRLILDILRQDRTLTTPQVLTRLRTMVGNGVIDAIDDETISWVNDRGLRNRVADIKTLKDRVSRAKRKIRDSG